MENQNPDWLNLSNLSFLDTDREEFVVHSPVQGTQKRSRVSFGAAGEAPKSSRPNGTTPLLRYEACCRVKTPLTFFLRSSCSRLAGVPAAQTTDPKEDDDEYDEDEDEEALFRPEEKKSTKVKAEIKQDHFPMSLYVDGYTYTRHDVNVGGTTAYYRCKHRRGKNPCGARLTRKFMKEGEFTHTESGL